MFPVRITRILAVLSLLVFPVAAAAQEAPLSLDQVLDNAAKEVTKYVETFKNLLSEESKTIEAYDKKGSVKKKTTIKSTFIVYQLTKSQNQVVEFRNVTSVDGKPVKDAERRAQDFFSKVVNAESSKKEIEQLRNESTRYDGELVISGLTLFQSPVLFENLRPFFDFKMAGQQSINGVPVYEITYQQIRQSPFITVNSKQDAASGKAGIDFDVDSDASGDLNGRLRGTLWIEVETFQIRREHRELTVQPEGATTAKPVIVNDFEFSKSDFGILTPSRITHLQSRAMSKGQPPAKEIGVTMEYSNFSKPDVEIKSSEVKNPKQ